MVYVISRLCRDCIDGACVEVCPVDCIVSHRPPGGEEPLPNQLYIDPSECIHCSRCEPECPWQAIYAEDDLPAEFSDDIELNAESGRRRQEFVVLRIRGKSPVDPGEVDENRRRWSTPPGKVPDG